MVSTALMIAVVLATHGEEPSREEKFRGALVQDSPEVRGSNSPVERSELEMLTATRPDLDPAMSVMGVSIGGTLLGGILLPFAFVGEAGVWFFVIGAAIAGTAILSGVITGIVLIVLGAEQTRIDARIRELKKQTATVPTGAVLARF